MPKRSGALVKKAIEEAQKLGVYSVGETIEGLACKLGRKPEEIVKLNSNENFFVPVDFLRSVLREVVDEVDPRIYPRDEYRELKEALCGYTGVSSDELVVGTGSDQLVELASRMMLRRGDEALAISPTFSIYKRCIKIQGATYKPVPLRQDFSLDTEALFGAVTPKTKLIFLCSPNNPTANQFSIRDIKGLSESFDGLVAVDEAYVDFASGSAVGLIEDCENLVFFRTFSKVFGLAGLRVGCAASSPELAKAMDERYQMPYSVTVIALKAALKILGRMKTVQSAVNNVKAERALLIERLNGIDGVRAFDSQTNFVLFQTDKSSNEVYETLLGKGVIVRNIGDVLRYENCLRVTVAPRPLMDRFTTALREALA
jgi:histidinol-phosphate aminotransferase